MSRQGRGKSRAHSRRGNRYDGSQVRIKPNRQSGKQGSSQAGKARRHRWRALDVEGYTSGTRMVMACLLPLLLAWAMQYLHLMPLDRPAPGYFAQWWQGALVLIGCVFGGVVLLVFVCMLLPVAGRTSR